MDKRTFIKTGGVAAAGLMLAPALITDVWASAPDAPLADYPHRLPPLPYAPDALEPHIDARTMRLHHEAHHQTYVDKLNAALKENERARSMSLLDLQRNAHELPEAIRNNGGGHYTHTLFWASMRRPGTGPEAPDGALAQAISRDLGGIEAFKQAFTQAAKDQFGSGWAWMSVDLSTGKLFVSSTPNQDNPSMQVKGVRHGSPILGLDVWEHAYYLKYQNKRAEYIDAFWPLVDWAECARRYRTALSPDASAKGSQGGRGKRTTPRSGSAPKGAKGGRQGSR